MNSDVYWLLVASFGLHGLAFAWIWVLKDRTWRLLDLIGLLTKVEEERRK